MATKYWVETFKDIIDAVQEEVGADPSDSKVIRRIKRDINLIYVQRLAASHLWPWLRHRVEVQSESKFSTGTAAVTANSTTVTLTESPAISYKGYYFSIDGYNERYRVAQHSANSSTLTLESPYTGSANSTASFKIWKNWVPLPADTRETLKVTHGFRNTPLDNLGPMKFEETEVTAPKAEGRPQYYSTGRFRKAEEFKTITDLPATASRSSGGYIRTIVFNATLGADEDSALIAPGDKIEISGAGHQAYNGEAIVASLSTTTATNDTITYMAETKKTQTSTADTGITIKKINQEDSGEAFRELLIYPSINDSATTLAVETIREVQPLENDDDEPLIPIEDRDILVYGALSRQWIKASDPETWQINKAEYDAKYREMVGNLEDSTDAAQLRMNKTYLRAKRRGGGGGSPLSAAFNGFGVEGGASEVKGTASRAAQFNADGRLVASDVTSTELGYLDGVTSGIQAQLDTKLGSQGAVTDNAVSRWDGTGGSSLQDSGVTIDDSDVVSGVTQLNVDNIRVDGNTISSTDTDGDINITPDGSGEVKAGGTADHVLINSATGGITSEAQLDPSRGGTGQDTSASTGVAKVSSGTWSVAAVVNADVDASAGIEKSKFEAGTASRVEVTDGSGFLTESDITTDELEYLDNMVKETVVNLSDNQSSAADVLTYGTEYEAAQFFYKIKRGSGNIEAGTLDVINDGTSTSIAVSGPSNLGTVGVTLSADISGGNVRVRYTSTSTGVAPVFKYKLNRMT